VNRNENIVLVFDVRLGFRIPRTEKRLAHAESGVVSSTCSCRKFFRIFVRFGKAGPVMKREN
jgi:hypothetical protein